MPIRETIRKYQEQEISKSIVLYYAGNEICEPGHAFGPAVRPHYLVHFILNGSGRYQRDKKTWQLHAGDAFLIYPGETTCYEADRNDPWEYSWIAFDGAEAGALLESCGFSDTNPVFTASGGEVRHLLRERMNLFEASFRESAANALEPMGYFYLLFSTLFRAVPALPDTSRSLYFKKAAEYMAHNYGYPVKISEIAHFVGVSRTYLYKVFESQAHMSVQEYLLRIRINAAKNMLLNTDMKITNIAYSCGFHDSPSFCRQFRKKMFVTPLKYRSGGNAWDTETGPPE